MARMGDLRLAARLLLQDRTFSLTAAFTLTVCIAANVALFAIVHHVLLKPLPIPDADRVVQVGNAYPGAGSPVPWSSSVPDYFDRLQGMDVFEEQALFNGGIQSLDQNGTPVRIRTNQVTPSFFQLLQVPPALGRTFTDEDGEAGRDAIVVISHQLWQSQFAGSAEVLGKLLRIDGQPATVVGVMPEGFVFVNPEVLLWRPLAFTPEQKSDERRHSNNVQHIGRLRADATLARAQQQVDAINAVNLERFPALKPLLIDAGFHSSVERLQDTLVRDVKPALYLMWGGALFVLFIGCVNIGNLVLARTRARMRDLATRLALGAGVVRLGRQLVAESVLLTLASATCGLLLGHAGLQALGALNIQDLPRGAEIRIDTVVVAATLAVAVVIGIVVGLVPLAQVHSSRLSSVLGEEGRSGTGSRRARLLRQGLVVVQVGFAFVLLVGAGLLLASFRQVLAIEPGFDAKGVLTASVALPRPRYAEDGSRIAYSREALRRLRELPGVVGVGATNAIPFGGNNGNSVIFAEGYQMKPGESVISPRRISVSPGYFEAMGVRIVRGRSFDNRDVAAGPAVPGIGGQRLAPGSIIVDETVARRFWPGQDPVGRRMYFPSDIKDPAAITASTVFHTVVGVVADVKLRDLTEGQQSVGAYYFSTDHEAPGLLTFAVKTRGEPMALSTMVRATLGDVDRELPVFDVQAMDQRMERSLLGRRAPAVLALVFGGVALLLSAVGIYGVLAHLVTQRRREFGIRAALGSSGAAIFALVVREGLLLIGAGLALGSVGAMAVRTSIESQLFGVSAVDPWVLLSVTGLLALVGVLACAWPARRATRVAPAIVLST
jgi:predicted permease